MNKPHVLLFAVVIALLLPGASVSASYPYAIDYTGHVVVACGVQPDQIEIRFFNAMPVILTVSGELWAQPTGGAPLLISSVPPQYAGIAPNSWGGPEERIVNRYPAGFSGTVWGWAQLALPDGTILGTLTIPEMPLSCDTGTPASPIEYETHSVAACGIEPNQVEIRIHNLMAMPVTVTGDLYAQPTGETPQLISSVPVPYQTVSDGNWGGPEKRLSNPYPGRFSGVVNGRADISFPTGEVLGTVEMADTSMTCAEAIVVTPGTYYFYLPMLSKY